MVTVASSWGRGLHSARPIVGLVPAATGLGFAGVVSSGRHQQQPQQQRRHSHEQCHSSAKLHDRLSHPLAGVASAASGLYLFSRRRGGGSGWSRWRAERHVVARAASSGPLRKLRLGTSDLEVTDACLGTMTWGIQNTEAEGHEQMDYAVKERGINFVDTAEMYPVPSSSEAWKPGTTEEIVGTWFAKNPSWREKVILATKVSGYNPKSETVGNRTVPPGPKADGRLDAKSVKAAVEGSLRRLQTDYIDLYQLHWPDRYAPLFGTVAYDPSGERSGSVPFEETLGALQELIKEGKIRHWGLSNETSFGVCEWARVCKAAGAPLPASIQNPFSLLNRDFEGNLAECCAPSNHNISLLPWSPLSGGALTGKYLDGKFPEGSRFALFPLFQSRYTHPVVMKAIKAYQDLAAEAGLSLTQMALQFCQDRWYVGSTIFGATSMEQLKENIDAFDGHVTPWMSKEILDKIDAIHSESRNPASAVGKASLAGLPPVPGRH